MMRAAHTILAQLTETHGVTFFVSLLVLELLVAASIAWGRGSRAHKILWCVIVLVVPIAGLILYAIMGRSSRDRSLLA